MPEPLDYLNPSTRERRKSRLLKGVGIVFGITAIGLAFGGVFAVGWMIVLDGWGLPELMTFGGLFGGIGLIVGFSRAKAYFR